MMTENLTEEAGKDSEAGQLPGFPNVVMTFQGAKTFVQEAPGLGEEVRFEVTGYIRREGIEYIEQDESERSFVVVKVTGLKQL